MEVHVVISSHPDRASCLYKWIERFADQTYMPDKVHLFLDGYFRAPPGMLPLPNADIYISRTGRGNGYCWIFACNKLPFDCLIIRLDDDVIIPIDYVEQCVKAYTILHKPFSWCLEEQMVVPYRGIRTDQLYGGHCVMARKHLVGLLYEPNACQYLSKDYCDDAFVSAYLCKNGTPLWQYAMPGLAYERVPTVFPNSKAFTRIQIEEATGWKPLNEFEIIDDPANHTTKDILSSLM